MWRLFRFLVLVVLCIPAWIAIQVAWEEFAPSGERSLGAHSVVSDKLKGERWRAVGMDPEATANAWQLTGLVATPGEGGVTGERVFLAKLRTVCQRYGDRQCWVVDELVFSDEAVSEPPVPNGVSANASNAAEAKRIKMVQSQLKALGFDPGPLDGAMGQKTRAALDQYRAQKSDEGAALETDDGEEAADRAHVSEAILAELEAMARKSQVQELLKKSDYHAAMRQYEKLRQLEPESGTVSFYRGVMYRGMGLPDLAIAEYDVALALSPDHELAFYGRGSAHYQKRHYWQAYGDYANGLGFRLLGDRYVGLRDRLVRLGDEAAKGFESVSRWAKVAWTNALGDGANDSLEEEGGRAAGADDEDAGPELQDANA